MELAIAYTIHTIWVYTYMYRYTVQYESLYCFILFCSNLNMFIYVLSVVQKNYYLPFIVQPCVTVTND